MVPSSLTLCENGGLSKAHLIGQPSVRGGVNILLGIEKTVTNVLIEICFRDDKSKPLRISELSSITLFLYLF